jgi:hypothetical protein
MPRLHTPAQTLGAALHCHRFCPACRLTAFPSLPACSGPHYDPCRGSSPPLKASWESARRTPHTPTLPLRPYRGSVRLKPYPGSLSRCTPCRACGPQWPGCCGRWRSAARPRRSPRSWALTPCPSQIHPPADAQNTNEKRFLENEDLLI